jgi:DNA polymerase III epsilon subunit-like protein
MQQFLTNNSLPYLRSLSKILERPLTFVDLEATGLVYDRHFSIIEIGLITILPDSITEKSALVDPQMHIPEFITGITGITDEMVKGKKTFSHFNTFFEKISKTHILCGFNSKAYDSSGLEKMSRAQGTHYSFDNQLDVRYLFLRNRNILLGSKSQKGNLTEAGIFYKAEIHGGTAHRAAYDIALTAVVAENIIKHHGIECLTPDIDKFACKKTKDKFTQYLNSSSNKP